MRIQLSDHFNYGKLIRFTLPSVAMIIFTSIYSVVDGFFVSNFAGKTPLAAINLVMPLLMILGTVGFMIGTGGTALVSKTYGEGDKEKANRYFSLFVYVSFAFGVLLAVLGVVFARPICALLGAQGQLLEDTMLYARIILSVLPFFILQAAFQSFFVAAEKPKLGLWVTVLAGLSNMILDAVLVLSLPLEHRLAGAAIATASSQVVGGLLPLIYFSRKNNSLLRLGKTTLDFRAIGKACVNGSSEFMSNISMSIVAILYNLQLMKYAGETGLAAYGVMMYASMIFSSAFFGYAVGIAPVIGYHYGSKNHSELKGLLRKSLTVIGILGVGMFLSSQLFAAPIAKVFVGYDVELFDMTVSGFRIIAVSFAFMGFGIFTSGFFTALNDGVTSAIVSFLRALVFQALCVIVFPLLWGLDGVWISVAVAEALALVVSILFLAVKKKKYNY